MVVTVNAKGFEDFSKELEKIIAPPPHVFIVFVGANDPATGKSWCPDCVEAAPIIEKAIKESAPKDSVIIYTDVGDRVTWKDPENLFRTDSRFLLTSIPTIIQYGTPKRLDEHHLTHLDTIKMLFEDAESSSSDK